MRLTDNALGYQSQSLSQYGITVILLTAYDFRALGFHLLQTSYINLIIPYRRFDDHGEVFSCPIFRHVRQMGAIYCNDYEIWANCHRLILVQHCVHTRSHSHKLCFFL